MYIVLFAAPKDVSALAATCVEFMVENAFQQGAVHVSEAIFNDIPNFVQLSETVYRFNYKWVVSQDV